MEEYLDILQAFVEGKMDVTEWRNWWEQNASAIEVNVGRLWFLRLKHEPFLQAHNFLQERGIIHQPDGSKCPLCGETLFQVVPGETTPEEISAFARRSTSPGRAQAEKERWRPGEYCPNGCIFRPINFVNPGREDLWKKLKADFVKTHTCCLVVQGSTTLPHLLSSYSVYVDGYIIGTRFGDTQPPNGELVWLLPGDHRIVVRESEVKKVNRLESNTLRFTAVKGVPLSFEVGMREGQLNLRQH